ncbi:SMI1/KNR4 family protein [Xenorhabdus sp. PB30.3]|uniref:SMI1/KNR4 family protein n=1 Tax=Xenorhabdus sp. PB30.3 TaxID=2788941 RepID=UPI001E61AFA4|nr:SMI1/KNR4 family protein [Xenorhabdus sp. PB30.3]MCC8379288.1 SMI1/KNR4 family protein [Xenorhabdus sp. PB30.3]
MKIKSLANELSKFAGEIMSSGRVVQGCDAKQLSELESKYGALPESYKLFLSLMGIDAGDFQIGTSISFDELDDINEGVIELMYENMITPPENMFAFLLHQGYSSLFFVDRTQQDPIVYSYTEGNPIKKTEYTFSEYILEEIKFYRSLR